MKLIPMLYSTPMVQAKLAKRKTQTRRLRGLDLVNDYSEDWRFAGMGTSGLSNDYSAMFLYKDNPAYHVVKCPYGQPGDILWTREAFAKKQLSEEPPGQPVHYLADGWYSDDPKPKWKPNIHMPYDVCRMWDEVLSIRCERVADINGADALAEGVEVAAPNMDDKTWNPQKLAIPAYRDLWNSLNARPTLVKAEDSYICYPFDQASEDKIRNGNKYQLTHRGKMLNLITNPWVWVITFKPTEKPAHA